MAHPTAGPTLVPFDRRFFSGGASSVRGWRLRQLGPGGAGPPDTTGRGVGDITGILGGDLKLETSVELRTTLLRNILAADWVGATFLDVGNVWFGPRNQGFGRVPAADAERPRPSLPSDQNGRFRGVSSLGEVGVGSGLGLRIEWEYLIVRFDLAYRLHDPSPQNDDVFSDTHTGPLLHFGIGQAF
jgi:outer membrane protein assembly factor BamA